MGIIKEGRKERLLEAGKEFRKKMKEKRLSLKKIVAKSIKIKKGIYSERFS